MYTADDDERTVLGGPAWDGGITCFLNPHDDFLFGPYHSQCPDVCPAVEYPRQLVFQPVDRRDLLRLFEDGTVDCPQQGSNTAEHCQTTVRLRLDYC